MNPPQHILVVEDEPDIRQLDAVVLSRSGYRVDTAENGRDALRSLGTDRFDLLIVEDELKKETGQALVAKLRSKNVNLPIILVVGTKPSGASLWNPWSQIQAVLLKPYTIAELRRTVSEVLRAASGGACFGFVPPSNWQGPTVSRWCAALTV